MNDDIQECETLYTACLTRRESIATFITTRNRLRAAVRAMETAATKGELAQEVHVQLSHLKLRLEEIEAELEGVKAEIGRLEASAKARLEKLVAEHFPAEHQERARELLNERVSLPSALLDGVLLDQVEQFRVFRIAKIDEELSRLNRL